MPTQIPAPRLAALAIGVGRLGLGAALLVQPEQGTRMLGLDTVTAVRISWLSRMTAARDIALGAGTVASAITGRDSGWWLIGGAASDAVDAVALAGAVRAGRLPPARAGAMVALALGAAVLGGVVAEAVRHSG